MQTNDLIFIIYKCRKHNACKKQSNFYHLNFLCKMHAISLNKLDYGFRLFIDQMHAKCMHFASSWSIFFQRVVGTSIDNNKMQYSRKISNTILYIKI